VISFKCLFFSK